MNLTKHLALGLVIRFATIVYGQWHDRNFHVPFTDVDYKVFTDAARYVTEGGSPYERHTYRYPPILAWLLVPNIFFHPAWGKFLFSVIDIIAGGLVHVLVKSQGYSESISLRCSFFWIYNPLSVIIATRGNSDSIIGCIVLLSVFYLFKNKPALTGVFLALAIHIRLYPIIFSLPIYLSIPNDNPIKEVKFHKKLFRLLYPNTDRLILVASCISTLLVATSFCYYLYGWDYLQESIFYHLTRKDTRHNFSVFFYLLYLKPDQPPGLIFVPQLVLLLVFSFSFGNKSSICFCLFLQTFTIVSYNPVLTSQYFIWYLSLLPPNLPRFKLTLRQAAFLTSLWLFAQLAWLVPAYLLEFRGKNTFLYIWFQGIGFFCANLAVLVRLIKGYSVKPD